VQVFTLSIIVRVKILVLHIFSCHICMTSPTLLFSSLHFCTMEHAQWAEMSLGLVTTSSTRAVSECRCPWLSTWIRHRNWLIRTTLDEGWSTQVQWNRAILLAKSHKLDPWPLDESPRPKSGKSRLNLHGTILGGKLIGLDPKKIKNHQNKSSWFGESRCKLSSKVG